MDTVDDITLLARLRSGDEAAFELMIRTHGGRMLAVARGIVRNDEDARDVVQNAYVSAFRGLATFKGTSQLSTWLHRIVVNGALMKLRTRRRKPEESIEALLPSFLEDGHHIQDFSEWAAQADRLLEDKEARHAVRVAIANLPESHRTVLMMRDIEEMPTEEVAAALGLTPNAVKIRLHRARQALGTVLKLGVEGNELAAAGIQVSDSPAGAGEGGTRWPARHARQATRSPSMSPTRPA
jgi:RNA polymerase sigma-70 factor, ECF subfamily